jgi:hypothetical protein
VRALAEPATADTATLSAAVSELASSLLADMLREEHMLAELVDIDAHGHVDQMTG